MLCVGPRGTGAHGPEDPWARKPMCPWSEGRGAHGERGGVQPIIKNTFTSGDHRRRYTIKFSRIDFINH